MGHRHKIRVEIVAVCFLVCAVFAVAHFTSPDPGPSAPEGTIEDLLQNIDIDDIVKRADAVLAGSEPLTNLLAAINLKAQTERQVEDLKSQMRLLGQQLSDKQVALTRIQQKVKAEEGRLSLLKLTPQQLEVVERYNKSMHHDPGFREWLVAHQTWFDVGKDVAVGLLLLWLGALLERLRGKHSRKRAHKTRSRVNT